MFFFFPPLKLDDGKVRINVLDSRESDDGRTTNVDFLHVTTTNEDGENLTTHFGIQGRSDHIAEWSAQSDDETSANPEPAAE